MARRPNVVPVVRTHLTQGYVCLWKPVIDFRGLDSKLLGFGQALGAQVAARVVEVAVRQGYAGQRGRIKGVQVEDTLEAFLGSEQPGFRVVCSNRGGLEEGPALVKSTPGFRVFGVLGADVGLLPHAITMSSGFW